MDEAMGDGWLDAVHPDDRAALDANWHKMVAEKNLSRAEYRFMRVGGTTVFVIGQAVPEYNPDYEVIGYIGTITDITELKEAEEALERSIEAERNALKVKQTIQSANLALTRSLDLKEVLFKLLDFMYQIVPYDRATCNSGAG